MTGSWTMLTEMLAGLPGHTTATSLTWLSALGARGESVGELPGTMQRHFHVSWPVPTGVLALILVATLAWVVAIYVREARGLADKDTDRQSGLGGPMGPVAGLVLLRLSVLALLLLLWAEPTIERSRMGAPSLVLLADRSASMNHRDPLDALPAADVLPGSSSDRAAASASARPTRFAGMVESLLAGSPSLLDRLEESYQVELVTFADQIRRLVPTGSRSLAELLRALPTADEIDQEASTRLGDAVDFALRGQAEARPAEVRPAAIILLSDGIGTRGEPLSAAATRARNLGVPLYTVAIGSERPRADLSLDQPIAVESVFLGDALSVEAIVRAEGLTGRPARVVLRNTATGQVLEQTVALLPPAGKGKTIHLQVRPTAAGRLSLELQVELVHVTREAALETGPAAGETNRSDSRSTQRQHPPQKTDDFFGEVSRENNRRRLEVLVHQEPVRVLLVQSSPSYEFRALKEVLQRDPALQMRVWLQEADSRFSDVDATALRHFPLGQQELLPYDVVIWGDVNPEPLPRMFWPRLLEWVSERGGGLALIAGPRFLPAAYQDNPQWGVLLPIRSADGTGSAGTYSIRPTALGRHDPCLRLAGMRAASEAVWRELPTFSWLWETDQVKPGAQPLAEATSPDSNIRWPAIVRHFVGAGEVWMHLTDETWRLRYRRDDRAFARYWGQVVRRLARGKLVAGAQGVRLLTDRSDYRLGEAVHVRAQFRNPAQAPVEGPLVLQCESSDQPRHPLELSRRSDLPGLFAATLREVPAGEYQLRWLPARSQAESRAEPKTRPMPVAVRFTVSAPPGELARLAVDRQTLAEAARETGGKLYTLPTAGRLPDDLPPALPVTLEHLPSGRLASGHTVIGLLVGLLAAEWILRRRRGLV